MSFQKEIHVLREKIINRTLFASVIFILIALIPSLMRAVDIGWQPVFTIHIFLTSILIIVYVVRKKISMALKAHFLFSAFLIIGIVGVINFKTSGGAFLILVVICIATLVFGWKTGTLYALLFVISIIIVGTLHIQGYIESGVNMNNYVNLKSTWFSFLATYIFAILTLLDVTNLFFKLFTNSIEKYLAYANELTLTNTNLKSINTRYHSIFEESKDGFLFVDDHFKIIDCNQSFIDLLGYEKKEITGKDYKTFLPDENKDWDNLLMSQADKSRRENAIEIDIFHKNGSLIPVEVKVNKIIIEDQLIFWSVIRDLQERKALEKQVFTSMILAEESERGRYARELHDGLGPLLSTNMIYLNVISNETNPVLIKEYAGRSSDLLKEAIDVIKEISNNLSPLILKEYGLVQATRSFIEKTRKATQIHFTILDKLSGKAPDTVESTIYRIVVELINNSIKYSQAKNVSITFASGNNCLSTIFTDDGEGFDYEVMRSGKNSFGLFNLENRVKSLGGKYNFETSPGKGVKVTILIAYL